jgi:uncharacterized membrane protein (UPF0127 family)
MTVAIRNLTRGSDLASRATLARSFLARGLGLMGRRALPSGGGLILYPGNNIHMLFMRFQLDIVFVNRHDVVVGLRAGVRPWIGIAWCLEGRYTLELPAGTIAASGTQVGDQLQLEPPV